MFILYLVLSHILLSSVMAAPTPQPAKGMAILSKVEETMQLNIATSTILTPRDEHPLCIPSTNRADCTFASRVQANGVRIDQFFFDNTCKRFSQRTQMMWPGYVSFDSQRGSIWIKQQSEFHAPMLRMSPKGETKFPDVCWDAGPMKWEPKFRIACRIPFQCPYL